MEAVPEKMQYFFFLNQLQKPSKEEPFDDESFASQEGSGRDAAG